MKTVLISTLFSFFIFISGAGFIPKKITMPFILRAFIGINLCCLLTIPILYFNAKLVNLLIPLLVTTGYLFIIKFYLTRPINCLFENIISRKQIINASFFICVFAIVSFTTFDFFPTKYIYSEHDLLYWSWATNFHAIDYSGVMRSEIAWPMHFTSYHLLSGMLPGYINYLGPLQNLTGIILIKFFIIALTISLIITDILRKHGLKILHYLISFSIPFLIFRQEISYSFLISNYLAVLIILILFWVMFQSKLSEKNLAIAMLFFILSFSKFVLFPIGIMLFFLYYPKNNVKFNNLFHAFLILVSTSNLLIWLFQNKPSEASSVDFYNPLSTNFFIKSLYYINWIVDPLLRSISDGGYKYILAGFALAAIIAKIFLLFAFCFRKLTNSLRNEIRQQDSILYFLSWLIFMLFAILGYIFLRVGALEIKHSAQLLFFASIVTFIFAGMFISKYRFSKARYVALIIVLLFVSYISPYRLNDGFSLISPMRTLNQGSISSISIENPKFIQSNLEDTHPQIQLKASIEGDLVECSIHENDRIISPIYLFLYLKSGETC
jgi:hypothetical protein